jgi:hypothetical protein
MKSQLPRSCPSIDFVRIRKATILKLRIVLVAGKNYLHGSYCRRDDRWIAKNMVIADECFIRTEHKRCKMKIGKCSSIFPIYFVKKRFAYGYVNSSSPAAMQVTDVDKRNFQRYQSHENKQFVELLLISSFSRHCLEQMTSVLDQY